MSGSRAEVQAVEQPVACPRVGRERSLARHQIGLDVIAAGVRGRDQLVGAAVGQQRGARLLAHGFVSAIVDRGTRVGPEHPHRFDFTGFVFDDESDVIERVGIQPKGSHLDFLRRQPRFERAFAARNHGAGADRAVFGPDFEAVPGRAAVGRDRGGEMRLVGVDFVDENVRRRRCRRSLEGAIDAVGPMAVGILRRDSVVVDVAERQIFDFVGHRDCRSSR